jgi:hypothetical protein
MPREWLWESYPESSPGYSPRHAMILNAGVRRGLRPNKRLKLAAPLFCGSLLFVNTSSSRRSLGAPR